jgi:hypothetical protein
MVGEVDACLQEQYPAAGILGQASGDDAAGGASAHHDDVKSGVSDPVHGDSRPSGLSEVRHLARWERPVACGAPFVNCSNRVSADRAAGISISSSSPSSSAALRSFSA